MKVHVRNIVEGALSRGLTNGYLNAKEKLLAAKTTKDELAVLQQISDHIWSELDVVMDFSDDDEETSNNNKSPVGFAAPAPADAVSTLEVEEPTELESEETEEEENLLRQFALRHMLSVQLERSRRHRS